MLLASPLPSGSRQGEPAAIVLDRATRDLTAEGVLRAYATTVYEPEIHAFGGIDAMHLAHALFHADSHHVLNHIRQADRDHRCEIGLLLGGRLMRAAGQDWYEQGDVWARVAAHRSPCDDRLPAPTHSSVRRLITGGADAAHSPLRGESAWAAAYERAGQGLALMAHHSVLTRGLRAVLAHHVLFAWNRMGISGAQQAMLAPRARDVVFGDGPVVAGRSPSASATAVVG